MSMDKYTLALLIMPDLKLLLPAGLPEWGVKPGWTGACFATNTRLRGDVLLDVAVLTDQEAQEILTFSLVMAFDG